MQELVGKQELVDAPPHWQVLEELCGLLCLQHFHWYQVVFELAQVHDTIIHREHTIILQVSKT